MNCRLCLLPAALGLAVAGAQAQMTASLLPDYTTPARNFPRFYQPYQSRRIAEPDLTNSLNLDQLIQDGKLRLSLQQLLDLVVANNLAIAAARYYPSIAQTDLLRARSGNSPRGLDASVIPSGVFSGAVGGSILGTAGGSGGGSSNPGGITGSASRVTVRPSGLFDPALSVSVSLDHTTSPLNSLVVAGVPSVTNVTGAFSANYVQAFSTGTSFTVSYGIQRQSSTQLHLLFDPDFTPGFTATVSQQLLNGFGLRVNRALIKVAENEQQIEREAFRRQAITTLSSAKNAYWDLAAAREAVLSAERALSTAQQLESDNRKQVEVGTMAALDVVTAQSQVATSQRDLIVAQTNLQNAEMQLKLIFAKRLDEPLASASIENTDPLPDPDSAAIPTLAEAIASAVENRPDVSIAQGNMRSQQDALPFIHNALLPNLNIFGLLTTVGLYNVFGTAFTEAIHFRYPEIAFGLTVSFPLHNRQAQADDIRSRMELRQAQDTLVRTKSQMEVDAQNALIAVTQSKAQAAAAREALRLEQQKLDFERQKLAAGLSTSYNVILDQRDLFAAELAETQARDAYAKARISLEQAMGTTLEADHISLDDVLAGQAK